MSESIEPGNKTTKLPTIGLIEKAWEWRWAMRLTYTVLFADITLLLSGQKNILQFSLSVDYLSHHFGAFCVTICAFGLFVSLVLPALAFLLRQLISYALITIPLPSFLFSEKHYGRPTNGVLLSELREEALQTQSEFLQKIYQREDGARTQSEQHREFVSMMIFGLLLLSLFDFYMPDSVMGAALTACDRWSEILGPTLIIICIEILRSTWFAEWQVQWVHYPPLYREIRAKQIAEEEECKAFMATSIRHEDFSNY